MDSASLVCARKTLNPGLGAYLNVSIFFLGLLYSLSHPERRTLSPHCDDSCFWPFLSDLEEEEEVGIFEASRSGFGSEVWGTFQSIGRYQFVSLLQIFPWL